VLAGLSLLPTEKHGPLVRLVAGAIGGGALIALVLWFFPGCLSGPYANLDSWLISNWIDRIGEAESLWSGLLADPATTIAVAAPVLLAIAVATRRVVRESADRRTAWVVYLVFLGVAALVMLMQVRAARMAAILALPAGAWLVAFARERYLKRASAASIVGLVFGWVGFAGVAWAMLVALASGMMASAGAAAGGQSVAGDAGVACRMPSAFAGLAALAPARVMAPVDLGSHILAFTAHSVVGAPYHRDVDGLHDTFDFFNGPIGEGRDILERRGIGLVVTCPGLPELEGVGVVAPDSFNRLFSRHALPDWLADATPPGSPLRIFAVAPRS
jgi:hypothetical protein